MNLACDLFKAGHFLASAVAGIDALLCEASILHRSVKCLVQCHDISATQPEVSSQRLAFTVALPLNCDTDDQAASAGRIDYKVQSTAVTMTTGAKGSHQILRQLSTQSSHKIPRFLPRNE